MPMNSLLDDAHEVRRSFIASSLSEAWQRRDYDQGNEPSEEDNALFNN